MHNLEESVTYTFSVRAQTIDYGPPALGNVTTGPQPGSPGRPRDLVLSKTISSVRLSWTNGNSGKGPILGYYIESRRKGKVKVPIQSYSILHHGDGLHAFSCHYASTATEEWQICE